MAGYSVTYTVVDNATKQIDTINRRVAAMRAPMERLSKQVSRFVDVTGLNTIAKGFASIGRAALTVLRTLVEIVPVLGTITGAATIAGMVKLVATYSSWSQQLTATADNMGMTTQQLQQFENAARLAGGRTSDMDDALKSLYKAQTDFVRGTASADQIGWFNRLGINVKDANGHLRSMSDLMPEVVQKISDIKNPADRAAASAALLGDANSNLVETFRQSHQSFGQWLTDAKRYTALTDQQKDQLQSFAEAQGRVGTAFDTLGQQISAMLAQHFTPLLDGLAKFVEKHTPQILGALSDLSKAFSDWVSGITWDDVEHGLKWVKDTLNDILAILRDLKQYWDDLKSVGDFLNRISKGAEDAGKSTHDWITGTLRDLGIVNRQANPVPELAAPPPAAPAAPAAPPAQQQPGLLRRWWNRISGTDPQEGRQAAPGPAAPLAPAAQKSAFYDEQRQLIYDAAKRAGVAHPEVVAEVGATQATLESAGGTRTPGGYNVYGIKSGGGVGRAGAPVGTTEVGPGGAYRTQASFAQFQSKEDAADAYVDFLRRNPRHYAGVLNAPTVEAGIHAQGTSGYATDPAYEAKLRNLNRAYGGRQDATVAAQNQPIKGAVDVNITHKNPPPDAAVTAQGTGAVNVPPPRVEHQQFATI